MEWNFYFHLCLFSLFILISFGGGFLWVPRNVLVGMEKGLVILEQSRSGGYWYGHVWARYGYGYRRCFLFFSFFIQLA